MNMSRISMYPHELKVISEMAIEMTPEKERTVPPGGVVMRNY
jgi:hypothetical protein